jgi:hypothetical protein
MTEPRPRTEAELVEFVRSSDVRAPDRLHREVEALIAARSPHSERHGRSLGGGAPRSRFALVLAGAVAIAAVVAVVIGVSLTGGGGGTLSLRETSALTLRAATLRAPAESHSNGAQLTAAVDGVSFPYWEDHFGWRSTGERSDRLDGRTVTTVFYQDAAGRRIGYAIVAGNPAPRLSGGTVAWRGGVPYRLLSMNGTHVISWLRDGHLCVVAGRNVDSATLLRLASWGERPPVAS